MDEFSRLLNWIGRHGGGNRLIDASELPTNIDIDGLDLDLHRSDLRQILSKLRMPSRRSYHLGSVTTGMAGIQSSASHRVVRGREGKRWKIYVSGPDFPDGEECMDEISSNDLLSEIESLGYQITLRQWIAMGWRPST